MKAGEYSSEVTLLQPFLRIPVDKVIVKTVMEECLRNLCESKTDTGEK